MIIENDKTNFVSVYLHEGKIFIKMSRIDPVDKIDPVSSRTANLHIKSPVQFSKLSRDFDAPESVVPHQPSTSASSN